MSCCCTYIRQQTGVYVLLLYLSQTAVLGLFPRAFLVLRQQFWVYFLLLTDFRQQTGVYSLLHYRSQTAVLGLFPRAYRSQTAVLGLLPPAYRSQTADWGR